MSLSIGIVGLPNVGKSTLFETITKKQVDKENYPFCTVDPNVGVVAVPDERVEKLARLTNSIKKIYTTIEFVDIAGLIKGASQGQSLGNKFLANIRETDAIVYVLRCFGNEKIINTQDNIDPLKDKEILDAELALKDLDTINKVVQRTEREAKGQNKEAIKQLQIIEKARDFLNKGLLLYNQEFSIEEKKVLNLFQFLTLKPCLYLLNGGEEEISKDIINQFEDKNLPYLTIDIKTEFEAVNLTPEERKEFGLPEISKLIELIKKSYELLGLITFLTTGSDETRAWTLKRGSVAPQAGGVIHTDFEKSFIKAEIINWQDLINAGGFAKAREKGLIRTEGKDYVVQDGDVIEIKAGN